MELKEGLTDATSEFWYDLTIGGYLKPEKMCKNKEDAKKVREAIEIVKEFEDSCNEQIEDFGM